MMIENELLMKIVIAFAFSVITMFLAVRKFKRQGKTKENVGCGIVVFTVSTLLAILYMPAFIVLICPLLAAIMLTRTEKKEKWESDDSGFKVFVVFILLVCSAFALYTLYGFNDGPILSSEKILYESIPLVAVEDGQNIQGSFVFASGNINGYRQYEYYYRDGEAIKYAWTYASDIAIFEENRLDGAIERYQTITQVKQSWLNEFIFGKEIIYKKTLSDREIHVPIGTVKRSMNFDLNE